MQYPSKRAFVLLDADQHIQADATVFAFGRSVYISDGKYGVGVSLPLEALRSLLAACEKAFENDLPNPEHVEADEAVERQAAAVALEAGIAALIRERPGASLVAMTGDIGQRFGTANVPADLAERLKAAAVEAIAETRRVRDEAKIKLLDAGVLQYVEVLAENEEDRDLLISIAGPYKSSAVQTVLERGKPRVIYNGDSATSRVNAWQKRGLVTFWYPSGGVEVQGTDLGRAASDYLEAIARLAEAGA